MGVPRAVLFLPFLFGAFLFGGRHLACAEESSDKPNFEYKTVTTKEGLVFRVPPDMPIEVRGGIQAPIPFDEYTYGKFTSLEAKISQLEKRLSQLEEKAAAE